MKINKTAWLAVSIMTVILVIGCQDMFKQHEDDEAFINAAIDDALELYDNEWYTGNIGSGDEVDRYRFRINFGSRYWIDWVDATNESGGLITGIQVRGVEDDGEQLFPVVTGSWEQTEKQYYFWAMESSYIVIEVKGLNTDAHGAYRIRCHQATEAEQGEEGFLPAPTVFNDGAIVVKWTAPANQSYQAVYRLAALPGEKFVEEYCADIFNDGDQSKEKAYTFVDYFTDSNTRYMYSINGSGHDDTFGYWETTRTRTSKAVYGVSSELPLVSGYSTITYIPTSGDLIFDPPLPEAHDHPSAGEGSGSIDIIVGESAYGIFIDNEHRSGVNIFDGLYDDTEDAEEYQNLIATCQRASFYLSGYSLVYYKEFENEECSWRVFHLNSDFWLHGEGYLFDEHQGIQLPRYRGPSGVKAEAVTESEINITWNMLDDIDHYEVWRSTGAGAYYEQIGTTDNDDQYLPSLAEGIIGYPDRGLNPGTTYHYKVIAIYPGENTGESMSVSATTPGNALAAPTNVTVTISSQSGVSPSKSLVVSWDWVPNATNYYVYRSTTENGEYTKITGGGTSWTSYTDTGLSQNTVYYYRVTAYNVDESEKSEAGSGKTGDLSSGIWYEDSLLTGDAVNRYTFNVSAGTAYRIRWDDSYQGSGAYTGDLEVRVSGCGAGNYWIDSGYTDPYTFTATSFGTVTIEARPYGAYSSFTGNYRIGWY
jgi:hypothetical protein